MECKKRVPAGARFAKLGWCAGAALSGRLAFGCWGWANRWRIVPVRDMFRGMSISMRYEPVDFSVVVKDRGQPPNRWRWEIYRAGRSSAVEQSTVLFPTMTAARKGGKEALARLFKKFEAPDFD
jgi:hypothetical protein